MLLVIAGYLMMIVFMTLIMTKRLSAMTAVAIVPVATALILGFSPVDIGKFASKGIQSVANTAIMIGFAITFFGTMIDAGLFDPLVNRILKFVKGDPLKVVVGTAVLAALVSLDGDGATTYLITTTAFLAVHQRLKINPLILPTVTMGMNSIWNLLPWGGPTGRVLSALKLETGQLLNPMFLGMVVATVYMLSVAYYLGWKERKRLGIIDLNNPGFGEMAATVDPEVVAAKRPKLFWVNLILTLAVIAGLLWSAQHSTIPLHILFMIAAALALIINYPNLKEQGERIKGIAENAFPVMALLFCAGILVGVLDGTKMLEAMSNNLISLIPASLGTHMGLITAILSMPGTYFLSNDAFYFGVLPILTKTAAQFGITTAEMGRAGLLGQGPHLLSPLVASTWLLVGIAGVEIGAFTKFALKWFVGTSGVLILVALVTGALPF